MPDMTAGKKDHLRNKTWWWYDSRIILVQCWMNEHRVVYQVVVLPSKVIGGSINTASFFELVVAVECKRTQHGRAPVMDILICSLVPDPSVLDSLSLPFLAPPFQKCAVYIKGGTLFLSLILIYQQAFFLWSSKNRHSATRPHQAKKTGGEKSKWYS